MEVFAHIGGQPLGMAFDRDWNLLVCVGGMGLYKVTPEREVHCVTDETNRSWASINDDSRLRLADDQKLVAECVEMPHALMAETALLKFVAYDPGGRGNPYLLAYTPPPPRWGDERGGFIIRDSGARLILFDAMAPRCREGF